MNKHWLSLLAAMLVTFVLGSVHAYSVFIVPLEEALDLPRWRISLIYSLALVAITAAVLVGYRLYARLPAWLLVAITCVVAAAGLMLAAAANSWAWLLFAYSLVFGFSNGIGYGFCLQLVGCLLPRHQGFAMGAVTAAYAVGSVVFAWVIARRLQRGSLEDAFTSVAVAVLLCGLVAALILRATRARFGESVPAASAQDESFDSRQLLQYWLAYACSVFAGLMAIGHAVGIALASQATDVLATRAAVTIGVGSTLGGFVAGWLIDRIGARSLLIGLPLISLLALIGLIATDQARITITLLSLVGFSYGAVIAVYPVAIANCFGRGGPRAYGLVFTAWGFAGLSAPWFAGWLYDWRADYDAALMVAAALALASSLCVIAFGIGVSPRNIAAGER